MFLTTRREPLIPPSSYQHLLNLQNQSVNYSNQTQSQNYPCVRPHHTVLSSSCSPSISSNSINVWTTINDSTGIKRNDKVPHYSALTTLGRLNNHHNTLHANSLHNHKQDESHKNVRWRTNERKFCFLLLAIGCILTFILLIFSLIFYFIVYKQGVSFGLSTNNSSSSSSNSNLVNSGFKLSNNFNVNVKHSTEFNTPSFITDKIKQQQPKKKRKRLIDKIEGELRIFNKPFRVKNHEDEVAAIRQSLNHFILRNLNLCLNNTEITQFRRGDNHDLNGIIINFVLTFNCALPNLAKRLAFSLKDSFKSDYSIDFRTLRLSPVFDPNHVEYKEVVESDSEQHWLKFAKNSEWGQWTDWSICDCRRNLVVTSRQRTCLNKTTNESAFSFSCGTSDEDNDEHLPSVEIRNCDCPPEPDQASETNLHQTICSKCEKTTEICLSYNSHMPNCVKMLNYGERCAGHCNSKGTECKYLKDKNMYQCLHLNETTTGDNDACLEDEFRCADGLCIPNIKYCDGLTNCFDNSDETNCPCDIQSGEYMHCGNSTSCIHVSKKCDGLFDCWDSSDEEGCFKDCRDDGEPSPGYFRCNSGNKECVLNEKVCNNFRDCIDGSDEIDCNKANSRSNL